MVKRQVFFAVENAAALRRQCIAELKSVDRDVDRRCGVTVVNDEHPRAEDRSGGIVQDRAVEGEETLAWAIDREVIGDPNWRRRAGLQRAVAQLEHRIFGRREIKLCK